MRRLFTFAGALGLSAFLAFPGFAQESARGTSQLTLNGTKVSVEYGRPSLRGRNVQDMLAELSPGDVWRLGADDSTTFSTTGDLSFGSLKVPKGDYSLWARKEADGTWKLVFNTQHGQYGTEHDSAKDLVAAPLKETKIASPVEQLTISLTKQGGGGEIKIEWGGLQLAANFKVK
jgi:hypothetical protein